MHHVGGIHHITAIAGDPQENLDFYVGVLGLRLVKKSVNQDAPDTYHLFYADGQGHPGTDLTFFPWPKMAPGRAGAGVWGEVAFAVPRGMLDYWQERLASYGADVGPRESRFGEEVLTFRDPHGMQLALNEGEPRDSLSFSAWRGSTVQTDYQIRALSSVRLTVRDEDATARFLGEAYGFSAADQEDDWRRYTVGAGAGGQRIDIHADPTALRGTWGTGSVHHVAFEVADEYVERAVRQQVISAGGRPTDVIDRFWFKSVYAQEPSGTLCEIATAGPGFDIDEDPDRLGEKLVLPPWYEDRRWEIESALPRLEWPGWQ
jgi:glyoxalase family protein